MTYAGLKSMIFAGVKEDDPRVKAVVKWIGKNYDLKSHPGQGNAGLYYYYHTFAKALAAIGDEQIIDSSQKSHDWRAEMVNRLVDAQNPDGSWINKNNRWLEGDANLVTAYGLLALSYSKPAAENKTSSIEPDRARSRLRRNAR